MSITSFSNIPMNNPDKWADWLKQKNQETQKQPQVTKNDIYKSLHSAALVNTAMTFPLVKALQNQKTQDAQNKENCKNSEGILNKFKLYSEEGSHYVILSGKTLNLLQHFTEGGTVGMVFLFLSNYLMNTWRDKGNSNLEGNMRDGHFYSLTRNKGTAQQLHKSVWKGPFARFGPMEKVAAYTPLGTKVGALGVNVLDHSGYVISELDKLGNTTKEITYGVDKIGFVKQVNEAGKWITRSFKQITGNLFELSNPHEKASSVVNTVKQTTAPIIRNVETKLDDVIASPNAGKTIKKVQNIPIIGNVFNLVQTARKVANYCTNRMYNDTSALLKTFNQVGEGLERKIAGGLAQEAKATLRGEIAGYSGKTIKVPDLLRYAPENFANLPTKTIFSMRRLFPGITPLVTAFTVGGMAALIYNLFDGRHVRD